MSAPPRGLVTLGQTMAVLRSERPGPLARGSAMRLGVAGAESNVAIGVRRLGSPATWIGHVGDDALGRMITRELTAEGVQVHATTDPARPTALMLSERRTADRTRVSYYRLQAAGAGLSPADVTAEWFGDAGLAHLTGITACLGEGPNAAVQAAVALAASLGLTVSLDLNHRVALATPEQFRAGLLPLVPRADVVFATAEEAALLLGADGDPRRLADGLRDLGATTVVLKRGREGSMLSSPEGVLCQEAVPVPAVDTVGAGDAFAAGFLSAVLDGADDAERLARAARVAAIAVATHGDWDGLPGRSELAVLADQTDISR